MTVGLDERSVRIVWHPCTQRKTHADQPPVAIARARGPWLYGEDGTGYLGGISNEPPNVARQYVRRAMARGLLLRPIGNTVCAMPPYVLEDETVEHLRHTATAATPATEAA